MKTLLVLALLITVSCFAADGIAVGKINPIYSSSSATSEVANVVNMQFTSAATAETGFGCVFTANMVDATTDEVYTLGKAGFTLRNATTKLGIFSIFNYLNDAASNEIRIYVNEITDQLFFDVVYNSGTLYRGTVELSVVP